MLDHVGIGAVDMAASKAFYTAVLAPLGSEVLMDFGEAVGFGPHDGQPSFWISTATAPTAWEAHVAFSAADRASVDAFYAAAVGAGAESLHAPAVHPEYHPSYYGAFVRDPDGNNIEAVCHRPQ
ncbi:MAG TPA: VOC family protein [Mycobacteriales bacterium]|nr:VOC family protein [Mycobacteriales bacterium]